MFEDILKRFSKEHAFLTKEKLYSMYEKVADDIEQGFKDKGVWTKAFADSGGDLQKQKAIYIELMVERLVLAEAALLEKKKKAQRVERAEEDRRNDAEQEDLSEQKSQSWSDFKGTMDTKETEEQPQYVKEILAGITLFIFIGWLVVKYI